MIFVLKESLLSFLLPLHFTIVPFPGLRLLLSPSDPKESSAALLLNCFAEMSKFYSFLNISPAANLLYYTVVIHGDISAR